jgi:hypothetical protein
MLSDASDNAVSTIVASLILAQTAGEDEMRRTNRT